MDELLKVDLPSVRPIEGKIQFFIHSGLEENSFSIGFYSCPEEKLSVSTKFYLQIKDTETYNVAFIRNGEVLNTDKTLNELDIKNGDIIICVKVQLLWNFTKLVLDNSFDHNNPCLVCGATRNTRDLNGFGVNHSYEIDGYVNSENQNESSESGSDESFRNEDNEIENTDDRTNEMGDREMEVKENIEIESSENENNEIENNVKENNEIEYSESESSENCNENDNSEYEQNCNNSESVNNDTTDSELSEVY